MVHLFKMEAFVLTLVDSGVLYKKQKYNYICSSWTTVYRLLARTYHNTTDTAKSLEGSCSWLRPHKSYSIQPVELQSYSID